MNTTGLTIALPYSRVSREEQGASGLSLDAQVAATRQYAADKGWLIGLEYQDVMSGMKEARPAYQAMLAEARRLRAEGKAVAIVVTALDRLGRRLAERLRVREEIKRLGIELHAIREGGLVSDLVANVLGAVAEEEARLAGVRVREVRARVIGNGWAPAGRVTFGYLRRPATDAERRQGAPRSVLDVDPERAPIAGEAFERVAAGASVRSVGRWLASLPTDVRQGRSNSFHAVRQMLASRTYIAQHPDGSPANWPPLVDPVTFERVRERIAGHKKMARQASGRYLLTGLIRCSRCGGRMAGTVRWRGRPRYSCFSNKEGAGRAACSYSAVAAPVERAVLTEVGTVLEIVTSQNPAVKAAAERAWARLGRQDEGAGTARRRSALERQAERARERVKRLALLFADGDLDRQGYELGRGQATADLEAAGVELERLGKPTPGRGLPPIGEVVKLAGGWQATLAASSIPAQREVLALLIDRVTARRGDWGKYEAKIEWSALGAALAKLAEHPAGEAA